MLSPADLRRPLGLGWHLLASIDTGTYMSASFTLFPPDSHDCFIVEEFPNYRYIGGAIELLGYSIPEWSRAVVDRYRAYCPGVSKLKAWADENSQFKTELAHYNIHLMPNRHKLELRTEIAREYFQNYRAWLAPWLTVLPYELEHASWPDAETSAGRFQREKSNDHTLDTIEHTLSRRPRHASMVRSKKPSFLDQFLSANPLSVRPAVDPHLGRH
jgi:hypothetical protein